MTQYAVLWIIFSPRSSFGVFKNRRCPAEELNETNRHETRLLKTVAE